MSDQNKDQSKEVFLEEDVNGMPVFNTGNTSFPLPQRGAVSNNPVQSQYGQPSQEFAQEQQMPQPQQEEVAEPIGFVYENSIPTDILENIDELDGGDVSAVFPRAVTQSMINQWKRQYKEVYVIRILERIWFYRPILRNEYITITAGTQDRFMTEEAIVAACVIWPKMDLLDSRADSAGIASSLSDYILKMSGFAPTSIPVKL